MTARPGSAWDRVADVFGAVALTALVFAAGLFVASVVALLAGEPGVSFVFARLLGAAAAVAAVALAVSFAAWTGPAS